MCRLEAAGVCTLRKKKKNSIALDYSCLHSSSGFICEVRGKNECKRKKKNREGKKKKKIKEQMKGKRSTEKEKKERKRNGS